jgi:hypothetical protein
VAISHASNKAESWRRWHICADLTRPMLHKASREMTIGHH